MKKFYKIILLLIIFIFLSTFNPKEFDLIPKKNDAFFKIQNIEIKNNFLIKKSAIEEKLHNIYKKKERCKLTCEGGLGKLMGFTGALQEILKLSCGGGWGGD